MRSYHLIIITLLLSLPNITMASEQTLRTAYYRQNIAPQLFFDANGRPTKGILFDITHAIADQLDAKLEMLAIPRKRIEQSLIRSIIDMHCVANKEWYQLKSLQWSGVLYRNPDILINSKGITSLADLAEHNELKIGLSLGYIYPELNNYINQTNIVPVISLSPADSYEKYRKNKIAGFVIPEIEASYLFKEIKDSVVSLNNNYIRCVLSPSMKKSRVIQINNAIEQLKSSGRIDTIISKYKYLPKLNNQVHEAITE